MGTALTERQLKELQRADAFYLCFDSDAAGEEATLRGMELAVKLGFDVRVVTLPKGQDPADAPAGFEARLAGAASYVVHRVRLELDRTLLTGTKPSCERGRCCSATRIRPSGRTRSACSRASEPAEGNPHRPTPRRADAHDRRRPRPSCLEKGERLERERAGRVRPSTRRSSSSWRKSAPSTSTSTCTGASRLVRSRRRRRRAAARASRRARRPRRAGRAGRAYRQGAPAPPARARLRRELAGAELERIKELQSALARVQAAGAELPEQRRRAATIPRLRSRVAQLAEHPAVNRRVVGSSPTAGVRNYLQTRWNGQAPPCEAPL